MFHAVRTSELKAFAKFHDLDGSSRSFVVFVKGPTMSDTTGKIRTKRPRAAKPYERRQVKLNASLACEKSVFRVSTFTRSQWLADCSSASDIERVVCSKGFVGDSIAAVFSAT